MVAPKQKGAQIFLDGKKVAETPALIKFDRRGDHKLRIEKEGYKTQEYDFKRKKGSKGVFNSVLMLPGSILAFIPNNEVTDNSNAINGLLLMAALPAIGYAVDGLTKATY